MQTVTRYSSFKGDPRYMLLRNLAIGYDLVCGMKPKALREKYQLKKIDVRDKFATYTYQLNLYLEEVGRPTMPFGYDDAYSRKAHECLAPVTREVLEEIGPYYPPQEYGVRH